MEITDRSISCREVKRKVMLDGACRANGVAHPYIILNAIDKTLREWKPPYLGLNGRSALNPVLEGKYADKRLTNSFMKAEINERHKFQINARTVARKVVPFEVDPKVFYIEVNAEYHSYHNEQGDELTYAVRSEIDEGHFGKRAEGVASSVETLFYEISDFTKKLDGELSDWARKQPMDGLIKYLERHAKSCKLNEHGLHINGKKLMSKSTLEKLELALGFEMSELYNHIACNGVEDLDSAQDFISEAAEDSLAKVIPELEACDGPAGAMVVLGLMAGIYAMPPATKYLHDKFWGLYDHHETTTVIHLDGGETKVDLPSVYGE